jgi:hypothetical protein
MEFQEFPKIGRLSRDIVVTEKIDGTNAQVVIELADNIADWSGSAATPWLKRVETDLGAFGIAAASRTRYITIHNDNHGWANWVLANANDLVKLGPGRHFGEWWGSGIQRGYGLTNGEKRFSLFNVSKWADGMSRPHCCSVVPTLFTGSFNTAVIESHLAMLENNGSIAAPGFMKPEGIVVFHTSNGALFKKTIERDAEPKGKRAA